jgi:GTP1/Obg family GTP-binding protein
MLAHKIKEFTSYIEITQTLDKDISNTKSMLSKYLSRMDEVRHRAESLKKLHSTLSKVVGRKALKESLGEINVEDMTIVLDASPLDELNALESVVRSYQERLSSLKKARESLESLKELSDTDGIKIQLVEASGVPETILLNI